MTKSLRCAIYTRKSSEEGLEQSFNSLHAQRDACAAYVLSQAGEGWTALAAEYDDGGFSGGTMERPGLRALLADIRARKVDVVVVYKVDRLTRSLADFARIVELFDELQVSFVSVTQAFNTTTSMGRLTLNVLLSFAQFEREVTGERIRDKIAASKAKGLWMGGRPPLGYDGVDLKLVVNEAEAEIVRRIFSLYLELGSVTALRIDLERQGVQSKQWINRRDLPAGGGTLGRGALYHMLSNPVYRGAIPHKKKVYPDAHPAIIVEALWAAVQAKLKANGPDRPKTPKLASGALLSGLLFDDADRPMRPVHTTSGAKRYRYYASLQSQQTPSAGTLPRIATGVADRFVIEQVEPFLSASWLEGEATVERVRRALIKVVLGEERAVLDLLPEAVVATASIAGGSCARMEDRLRISIPIRLKHRQGAQLISSPGAIDEAGGIDRPLVRAVCLARSWANKLANGEIQTIKALARHEGLCEHYTARLLPLAWLAPDLVEMILDGRQPKAVSLSALTAQPLPMDWLEQRQQFDRLG